MRFIILIALFTLAILTLTNAYPLDGEDPAPSDGEDQPPPPAPPTENDGEEIPPKDGEGTGSDAGGNFHFALKNFH